MKSNLLKLFSLLFFIVFILSPFYFWYDSSYSNLLLFKSVSLNLFGFILIYYPIRYFYKVKKTISFYEMLRILQVVLFIIIFSSLFLTDIDSLKIERGSIRNLNFFASLLILHIPLVFISSLMFFYYNPKSKTFSLFLICLSLFISLYIAYAEGRRTAALIPLAIVSFSFFYKYGLNFKNIFLSIIVISSVFYLITEQRVGADLTVSIFDLIIHRILNPGHMSLKIFESSFDYNFNTSEMIVNRFENYFGIRENYNGIGNEFGRVFKIIEKDNYSVNINPGVINELFLSYGFFGFTFFLSLLGTWVGFIMKQISKSIPFGDFFVIIEFFHGLQMEVGYTIGSLAKITLVIFLFNFIIYLLPKKSERKQTK